MSCAGEKGFGGDEVAQPSTHSAAAVMGKDNGKTTFSSEVYS
jgi:hypothetical protein